MSMRLGHDAPSKRARRVAWTLFCRMHAAPSAARAEQLVRWLGEDARNVQALDDALTLWALAGAALLKPALDESDQGRMMQ